MRSWHNLALSNDTIPLKKDIQPDVAVLVLLVALILLSRGGRCVSVSSSSSSWEWHYRSHSI
jgi:hypothetical protein